MSGAAMVERVARALYDLEPFYLPAGQMIDGVELARKIAFDDAPAYRQERARQQARTALAAQRIENVIYYVNGRPNASLQDIDWNKRIDAALAEPEATHG